MLVSLLTLLEFFLLVPTPLTKGNRAIIKTSETLAKTFNYAHIDDDCVVGLGRCQFRRQKRRRSRH